MVVVATSRPRQSALGYLKTQKRLVDKKKIHIFRVEPDGKLTDVDVLQFFSDPIYRVQFDATRCCVQKIG